MDVDSYSPYLTRVVVAANGKGGVGKTSVATNVAGLAAVNGWRVLFIDMDPQGDAAHDFGYGGDDGQHLADAIEGRAPMKPVTTDVRPGLDVIPGGAALDNLESYVVGMIGRGVDTRFLLAKALAPLAGDYDLIMIDTPPTRPVLLQQALSAARWLLIPTKSDRASIEGLTTLAGQLQAVRGHHPQIDVLGAVLFGVGSGASTVRQNALTDVKQVLDADGAVFNTVIRHVEAAAVEARYGNQLIHELAAEVENAEPYYAALKAGREPVKLPGSAPRLAGDYMQLTIEILESLTEALSDELEAQEA